MSRARGGVDGVRRARDTRQIRARISDLHDSAGVLSAGQANLLGSDIAEARARAYPDGKDAFRIGGQCCCKNPIEINLHALSCDPARGEYAKGGSCTCVSDLVGNTHESFPGAHRRAFRAASIANC